MGAPRRGFGWVADTTTGGSPYDTLVSGAIPDATELWPVRTVDVDKGEARLDRNDDITGRRGQNEPQEFLQAPSVTVKGRLIPPIAQFLLKAWTGATAVKTGTAPAAITSKYEPVDYGVIGLPAYHLSIVRDDLYEKVAGCQLDTLKFTFPLKEHATFEAVFRGLYRKQETGSFPSVASIASSWVYLLRDAQALIAGSGTGIDGLTAFEIMLDNKLEDAEHWAKRNRVVTLGSGGDRDRILWYPQQRVLGADRSVGGSISFSDVKTAEDQASDLAKARQLVFEIEADTLATTPSSKRLLRVTGTRGVYTGGGASPLQKDGRITSQYDLGLFLDSTTGKDVKFETTDVT